MGRLERHLNPQAVKTALKAMQERADRDAALAKDQAANKPEPTAQLKD